MLFPEHAVRLTALPRVSVNGRWQKIEALEALLSGDWLWTSTNRFLQLHQLTSRKI
jgi:hypothetical protein